MQILKLIIKYEENKVIKMPKDQVSKPLSHLCFYLFKFDKLLMNLRMKS